MYTSRASNSNVNFGAVPQYSARFPAPVALWERVYNLVDGKVYRLSWQAYVAANRGKARHVPYTVPAEVDEMVAMLGELDEHCTPQRCEEIAGFATSPGVNQLIFGGTLC